MFWNLARRKKWLRVGTVVPKGDATYVVHPKGFFGGGYTLTEEEVATYWAWQDAHVAGAGRPHKIAFGLIAGVVLAYGSIYVFGLDLGALLLLGGTTIFVT